MTIPPESCHDGFRPGRVWSLWDMINFNMGSVRIILSEIGVLVNLGVRNADWVSQFEGGHKNPLVRDNPQHQENVEDVKATVTRTVEWAQKGFAYLKCPHIDAATKALGWWTQQTNPTWEDLRMKSIALRDAINTELKQYFYYQYPKAKAQVFQSWKDDWKTAISSFPSIELEVLRATDCYALGHDVASVFHSMRTLEFGLRAVAADVGLTFDLQQWHNIIDQIESSIAAERKTLPRGEARNERLQFLSEAAKEFFYFKEGWRNHVAHNRADYDEHQALSVLIHVRTFMNHLASRLSE